MNKILAHVIWNFVFILFKFKKRPNISGIRVVDRKWNGRKWNGRERERERERGRERERERERERKNRVRKGPRDSTWTQDAHSAMALYADVLPTRLLAPAKNIIKISLNPNFICYQNEITCSIAFFVYFSQTHPHIHQEQARGKLVLQMYPCRGHVSVPCHPGPWEN